MAEADSGSERTKEASVFGEGIPQPNPVYDLKGSNNYDWGMKDRLSRVFDQKSKKSVMLAFDHGYILGPSSGLERIDMTILPIIEHADCIMCCRGVLRSVIPPTFNKPVSLRCSAGSTVLTELNNEIIGVEIEDAIRLNATMMAAMVSIGGKYEALTVKNMCRLVETGNRYGIPTLGVTAVGKELKRDARYLSMASRVLAENGAQVVKTYFCEPDFYQVTHTCPVPIVIAGGKKLPELDALKVVRSAIDQGASGVDMGRNVFQSECPVAMIQAVRAVVHDDATPEDAFELYNQIKTAQEK